MDPYFQQRLRDEVIYLHSLWHQGPPSSFSSSSSSTNPNPNPNPRFHHPNPNPNRNPIFNPYPNPYPYPNPNPTNTNRPRPRPRRNITNPSQPDLLPQSGHQGPSSSFSKRKRNRDSRHDRERPAKKNPTQPDPLPPHTGPPWPCPSPARDFSPGSSTQWPAMPAKPNSATAAHPPSPEEQARVAALKLQHGALDSCRGLFSGNAWSDGEESEAEGSEDGEDYWVENRETEEYKVLLNLFVERSELRRYYEVNYENGEFCCLVCGGLGKKKRVRSCVGLVQHSISVANTKKKRAHRAFAQVVCRVLGWDFDRLPTIVLKGERLGLSLEKPGQERGKADVNAGSGVSVSVEYSVAPENAMEVGNAVEDNVAAENVVENNVAVNNTTEDNVADENAVEDIMADENAVEDIAAAENNANAGLGEKEAFDDHQNKGKEIVDCQKSFEDDNTNKSTESIDNGIQEMEANKEAADTWGTDQTLVSKTEWPCKESSISSLTELGWPTFSSPPASSTCSIPVEEQARFAAAMVQQKALKECLDFFSGKDGSYSDEDNSEDDDEGDLMDEDGSEESELKFFSKIFTEDGELRSFYEKNYEGGEFCCLVCCALRKKGWKRFKGGVALLQHCNAILKTKKKAAHRAYGQVICSVSGWDISRPPTIRSKDKPLQEPLSKSDNLEGEVEENVDNHKDNMVVSKENLDCTSSSDHEIVSTEESDVAHGNETSKTAELQGVAEENAAVTNENMDSISGYNGEIVSKEESDVGHSSGTSKTPELLGEPEENVVVSNENLDSLRGHNGEIVSKEESDVAHSDGTSTPPRLQAVADEIADGRNDDLNVFMESLETVVLLT